jgi:hypothetical protein
MDWQTIDYQGIVDFTVKILAVVGGLSGITYWVDRWRNRVRLSARILSIDATFFTFEVENHGNKASSLRASLVVRGFCPVLSGQRVRAARIEIPFDITAPDRKLEPKATYRASAFLPDGYYKYQHQPELERLLGGIVVEDDARTFFYPRYHFRPTSGKSRVFYSRRHARTRGEVKELSQVRYWLAVIYFIGRCRRVRDVSVYLKEIDSRFEPSRAFTMAAARHVVGPERG